MGGAPAGPADLPAEGGRDRRFVVTLLAWIILVVGAVIVGAVAQWVMKAEMPFRWVVTAIGAFIGALVSSELLFAGTTPTVEGIAVWPA